MINPIRLSICIPTYNRGKYIGETLSSILPQCSEKIDIVIVDGASTDNTESVVRSFQSKYNNIHYKRNNINNGVDRDMAHAVELATGDYCWLMSSDDLINPDAIEVVIKELDRNYDIYLCDITLCDKNMIPIRNTSFLSHDRNKDIFKLSQRSDLIKYLKYATSNNALFCYMSSIIFKRKRWQSIGYNEQYDRSGYAHVYTLLSFTKTNCFLKYLPTPLVRNRADNDSFSSMGLEKRFLLDFNGYRKLADDLFCDDEYVHSEFLRVTTREHPWYRIVKLRASIKDQAKWKKIQKLLLVFGYSKTTLTFCDILGRNTYIVNAIVKLNHKFPRSDLINWLR